MTHTRCPQILMAIVLAAFPQIAAAQATRPPSPQIVRLNGDAGGRLFEGVGVVNGGGATSVLLKDYPEPQRSQILDLVYKPRFGASVSALLIEIPGDGNSTQGSMPSHMHTRDDLNYHRGYMWWILTEVKKRNAKLTLDGTAWSAPGWVGNGNFWSQDAADYYIKWLQGLRSVHGLEFDAIGCRNEKGVSYDFARMLRTTLNAHGFENVRLHAFDDWGRNKLNFVRDMLRDPALRDAIDIIGAHTFTEIPASPQVQQWAAQMNKPIWNTEEHIYKKGFDCAISIVNAFNINFIQSGATRIVNWYDIAGVYPMEPYSEDPAAVLARSPWSGHYHVREALWGYAHYGQFCEAGWQYLEGGSGNLAQGGTFVTLKSPGNDFSMILESRDAKAPQQLRVELAGGLPDRELCLWRSNASEQFVQLPGITPTGGAFTLTLEPGTIYSLSSTTGQQKGAFPDIPADKPFPFPYFETFESYADARAHGYLPRYTADIYGAFELVERPEGGGKAVRQAVPIPAISWAPDWHAFTILGDDQWADYEVSADIYLHPGEAAAVLGRVNHVGTGYGFIPKGYFVELAADGALRLVVSRGKKDPRQLVGDAEQQRLIAEGKDEGEGGEKVLATARVAGVGPGRWHNLKLRFEGATVTAFVDGTPAATATDRLYERGMAGLMTINADKKIGTAYFDNLLINRVNAPVPPPSTAAPGQTPIYADRPGAAK